MITLPDLRNLSSLYRWLLVCVTSFKMGTT